MSKNKSIFVQGSISPDFIARSIANHRTKTEIGAHEIFLGQVRADEGQHGKVMAIEYTSYIEMAEEMAHEIREKAFEKFGISCLHIHHSLGTITAGEFCFFVFASSPHRSAARDATKWIVESVKQELPIFGKEIFENKKSQWKVNTDSDD